LPHSGQAWLHSPARDHLDDRAKGQGIEASLHLNAQAIAKTNANAAAQVLGRLRTGDEFNKAGRFARGLLVSKSTAPLVELVYIDLVFTAEGYVTQITVGLLGNKPTPICGSFFSRHRLHSRCCPPLYDAEQISAGVTIPRTGNCKKTYWADAYDARKEAPTNQSPDQWGQLLGKAWRTHLT